MNFQYIRDYYGVPAEIGRRVTVYGKPGIIAADCGNYIGVNFDASKPGKIDNCHPTDQVEYLGMGTIRPMSRERKRYLNFLDLREVCPDLTFREFLTLPWCAEYR